MRQRQLSTINVSWPNNLWFSKNVVIQSHCNWVPLSVVLASIWDASSIAPFFVLKAEFSQHHPFSWFELNILQGFEFVPDKVIYQVGDLRVPPSCLEFVLLIGFKPLLLKVDIVGVGRSTQLFFFDQCANCLKYDGVLS